MSQLVETYKLTVQEITDGYGVEDIAVRHGLPVQDVRAHVKAMRFSGAMARIFPAVNEVNS